MHSVSRKESAQTCELHPLQSYRKFENLEQTENLITLFSSVIMVSAKIVFRPIHRILTVLRKNEVTIWPAAGQHS